MSAAPKGASLQEIRAEVKDVKEKIEAQFPDVDVEFVDKVEIYKDWPHWQARGFPPMSFGVDACLLIRGDVETTEEAALIADGEAGRLLEEGNVVLQVRRDTHVWCKKSVSLVASSVPALKPTASYIRDDNRGIVFLCFFDEPHDHEWGRLKPQE